jgi:putative addiction module component (TIGR02574 family)
MPAKNLRLENSLPIWSGIFGDPPGASSLPIPEKLANTFKRQYVARMSIAAEKIAEVLALPAPDRAFLARELIASLDSTVDADAETEWNEVIDRRSRELTEGRVDGRSEEEMIRDIRAKLHARHPAS